MLYARAGHGFIDKHAVSFQLGNLFKSLYLVLIAAGLKALLLALFLQKMIAEADLSVCFCSDEFCYCCHSFVLLSAFAAVCCLFVFDAENNFILAEACTHMIAGFYPSRQNFFRKCVLDQRLNCSL